MSFHNFSFESFNFDNDDKWMDQVVSASDSKTDEMEDSIFNVFSVIDDDAPLADPIASAPLAADGKATGHFAAAAAAAVAAAYASVPANRESAQPAAGHSPTLTAANQQEGGAFLDAGVVADSPSFPLVVPPAGTGRSVGPQKQHKQQPQHQQEVIHSSPVEALFGASACATPKDDGNSFTLDKFIGKFAFDQRAAVPQQVVVASAELLIPPQKQLPPRPSPPCAPSTLAVSQAAVVAAAVGPSSPTVAPSSPLISSPSMTGASVAATFASGDVASASPPRLAMVQPTASKQRLRLELVTAMESLWYADRVYPAFTVELRDSKTGQRLAANNVSVRVGLRDGFGNSAPDKLSEVVRDHTFIMHNGTLTINSLRFRGVSSKAGGHFRIVLAVEDQAQTAEAASAAGVDLPNGEPCVTGDFVSEKIQVLSYRLYHAPKVDAAKLRPEDAVSKMKGIGSQYAKRLASLGIKRIDQLAAINIDVLGQDGTAQLLHCLRKERGALTQVKLAHYIAQAAEICRRHGDDSKARQTHTVARSATNNAQPRKRQRNSLPDLHMVDGAFRSAVSSAELALKRMRAVTGMQTAESAAAAPTAVEPRLQQQVV